jgi:hypothetical protein
MPKDGLACGAKDLVRTLIREGITLLPDEWMEIAMGNSQSRMAPLTDDGSPRSIQDYIQLFIAGKESNAQQDPPRSAGYKITNDSPATPRAVFSGDDAH